MNSDTSPPSIKQDADAVFQSWTRIRQSLQRNALSDKTVAAYALVWTSWQKYLPSVRANWKTAGSAELRSYLQSLAARKGNRTADASPVTQRRYFRILQEIYACAVANGQVSRNPAVSEAAVSRSEQMDSLVFNTTDWRSLYEALAQVRNPAVPPRLAWAPIRDHAILLLILQSALTVTEIIKLTPASIEHPRLRHEASGARLRPHLAPWEPSGEVRAKLIIQGARDAQSRVLTLPEPSSNALLEWLQIRLDLPGYDPHSSPLFVSRKRTGPGAGRLTPQGIFLIANRHITATLGRELAHAGPAALRNSCIVRWLDSGASDDEILARAGLKDAQALTRLRKHTIRSTELAHPTERSMD